MHGKNTRIFKINAASPLSYNTKRNTQLSITQLCTIDMHNTHDGGAANRTTVVALHQLVCAVVTETEMAARHAGHDLRRKEGVEFKKRYKETCLNKRHGHSHTHLFLIQANAALVRLRRRRGRGRRRLWRWPLCRLRLRCARAMNRLPSRGAHLAVGVIRHGAAVDFHQVRRRWLNVYVNRRL